VARARLLGPSFIPVPCALGKVQVVLVRPLYTVAVRDWALGRCFGPRRNFYACSTTSCIGRLAPRNHEIASECRSLRHHGQDCHSSWVSRPPALRFLPAPQREAPSYAAELDGSPPSISTTRRRIAPAHLRWSHRVPLGQGQSQYRESRTISNIASGRGNRTTSTPPSQATDFGSSWSEPCLAILRCQNTSHIPESLALSSVGQTNRFHARQPREYARPLQATRRTLKHLRVAADVTSSIQTNHVLRSHLGSARTRTRRT